MKGALTSAPFIFFALLQYFVKRIILGVGMVLAKRNYTSLEGNLLAPQLTFRDDKKGNYECHSSFRI